MPETPPSTGNISQNRKWLKFVIIILVFLFGLTTGIAGYAISQKKFIPSTSPVTTKQPETTIQESKPPAVLSGPSFQEILENKCQLIETSPTVSFYGIKPEDLPVTIDQSVVEINFREKGTIACSIFEEQPKTGSVNIEYGDHKEILLYDGNSQEGGHGGPLFFGSREIVIKDDGTIKWSMSLNWPHAGCADLDNMAVIVRGERKLKLANGETIFANTETQVIDPGDTRLVEILQPNTKDSECEPGKKELFGEGIDEKVKEQLFNNFDELGSPEKERVDRIRKMLMAISSKTTATAITTSTVSKTVVSSETLTKDKALSLAAGQLGGCECTSRDAVITQVNSNTWTVTVTDSGLADDSIAAKQTVAAVTYQNSNWVWNTTSQLYRCAPGRGHQNFSAALCL